MSRIGQEKMRTNEEGILYRIKSLQRAGYTQKVIAKRLKVSQPTISGWIKQNRVPAGRVSTRDKKTFNRFYSERVSSITESKQVLGIRAMTQREIKQARADMVGATPSERAALQQEIDDLQSIQDSTLEKLIADLKNNKTSSDWTKWRGEYKVAKGEVDSA